MLPCIALVPPEVSFVVRAVLWALAAAEPRALPLLLPLCAVRDVLISCNAAVRTSCLVLCVSALSSYA